MGRSEESRDTGERPLVLIAGGGIAGVEAALAVRTLVGEVARVRLLSADRDFVFRPGAITAPFTDVPLERHELEPMLSVCGIEFAQEAIAGVFATEQRISTRSGRRLDYDFLIVCVGARVRPAYAEIETFWPDHPNLRVEQLIEEAGRSYSRHLALVIPPDLGWTLPMYELGFMLAERTRELGRDLGITIYTSERAPVVALGDEVSAQVARDLAGRAIAFEGSRRVVQDESGRLVIAPQGTQLDAGVVISLPRVIGPRVPGLPADPHGFIVVDEFGRVEGLANVYAAGDGTNTPVKQGGLAAQQADAAAEHVAAQLGVSDQPSPFEPTLNGWLRVDAPGGEPARIEYGRSKHGSGRGETKVSARYLSGWLSDARKRTRERSRHRRQATAGTRGPL